jgi:hypothetical protein
VENNIQWIQGNVSQFSVLKGHFEGPTPKCLKRIKDKGGGCANCVAKWQSFGTIKDNKWKCQLECL